MVTAVSLILKPRRPLASKVIKHKLPSPPQVPVPEPTAAKDIVIVPAPLTMMICAEVPVSVLKLNPGAFPINIRPFVGVVERPVPPLAALNGVPSVNAAKVGLELGAIG
jgi:hypothetical protein